MTGTDTTRSAPVQSPAYVQEQVSSVGMQPFFGAVAVVARPTAEGSQTNSSCITLLAGWDMWTVVVSC
jgi:hypothetical protein